MSSNHQLWFDCCFTLQEIQPLVVGKSVPSVGLPAPPWHEPWRCRANAEPGEVFTGWLSGGLSSQTDVVRKSDPDDPQ